MSNFTTFEQLIIQNTISAMKDLFEVDIQESQITLNEPPKDFDGETTLVLFPFVRFTKKSPEETGSIIGEYLQSKIPFIKTTIPVKGFLNIAFSDQYWISFFKDAAILPNFGKMEPKKEKILIEYSSPNTNKPLHLGHVRNNVLGFALAGLLKENGYDVSTACLVNDRGVHICKSMLAWQKYGNGETPQSSGLKGDKLVGKYYVIFDQQLKIQTNEILEKWAKNQFDRLVEVEIEKYNNLVLKKNSTDGEEKEKIEAAIVTLAKAETPLMIEVRQMLLDWENGETAVIDLWKTMNGWVYEGFAVTYKALGVAFDKYYYESNTYLLGKNIVEEGLEKGVFFKKSDNSVWIDLTADGLDEKLVLRGDGTSVYITQDIGTADLKYSDFAMDKSIYVVGNEQDYHFKVLKLIAQKLQKPHADGIFHYSYGMVDLPSGKMKSREGTVVDADDLVQEMIDAAQQQTEELGKVEGFSASEAENLYRIIGLSALKFFLLRVDPKKRILFDPLESIDLHGYTAAFVQYTYARTQSIMRRAAADASWQAGFEKESLSPSEKELLQFIYKYPSILAFAGKEMNPALIIDFTYNLAKLYNKFYAENPIFAAENKEDMKFRIAISALCGQLIQRCFHYLGMEVPEKM
ncbi:MAG: arginine--tRNA ligase [Bacteroidetes bacterium]|nr:arginine--tRNA ligase [Bacteroidota bacterium]